MKRPIGMCVIFVTGMEKEIKGKTVRRKGRQVMYNLF